MMDLPAKAEAFRPQPAPGGFWRESWQRFRRKPFAMAGLIYVIALSVTALLSPALAGTRPIVVKYKGRLYFPAMYYFHRSFENPIFFKDKFRGQFSKNLKQKDPESWAIWPLFYQDPLRRIRADEWPGQPENATGRDGRPNKWNKFGTTEEGVDVLAVMIHGCRIALLVGFVSTGIASLIGVTLGAIAGYAGGWWDNAISRFTEVVMCVPTLIVILALLAVVDKPSIWYTMAVLGLTGWTGISRLTRAEFLKLRTTEYVTAARALGGGWLRVVFRHILPNALAPILVPISFGIASAILLEAGLSLLGVGSPPDTPSWGNLLNKGRENFQTMWWLTLFPGAAIFLTVLAYNLIGEGLQEATDPRLRESMK